MSLIWSFSNSMWSNCNSLWPFHMSLHSFCVFYWWFVSLCSHCEFLYSCFIDSVSAPGAAWILRPQGLCPVGLFSNPAINFQGSKQAHVAHKHTEQHMKSPRLHFDQSFVGQRFMWHRSHAQLSLHCEALKSNSSWYIINTNPPHSHFVKNVKLTKLIWDWQCCLGNKPYVHL